MGPWEVLGVVAVAVLGAGGPISLLITRKTSQESKETIQKSTETIEKGTEVLAASKETIDSSHDHSYIINRRLRSIEHTLGIATDLGANMTVDNTDPENPVISATGGGGSSDETWELLLSDEDRALSGSPRNVILATPPETDPAVVGLSTGSEPTAVSPSVTQ